jgi:hypothetical protein
MASPHCFIQGRGKRMPDLVSTNFQIMKSIEIINGRINGIKELFFFIGMIVCSFDSSGRMFAI